MKLYIEVNNLPVSIFYLGHCTYSAEDRLFCLLLQDELSEAKRIYPTRTSLQTVVNGLESAESDCELPL